MFKNTAFLYKSLCTTLMVLLLLSGLCLLPGASSEAKAITVSDVMQDGKGYTSVLYDNTSGLPTSEANAIVQTKDGFLWIGSYSGLVKYDGNEFYRYDSSVGLSSVVSLFVDSKDRLWIGTNDNGVAMMNEDEELTFYDQDNGLASSSVRTITQDKTGIVYFGTTMGLAYLDENNKIVCLDDGKLKKEYIHELVCGEDGVIYGVTHNGELFTLQNRDKVTFYDMMAANYAPINTVYPDPKAPGYVFIGTTESEVIRTNLTEGMTDTYQISVAPDKAVNRIYYYADRFWICTDSGISYLDEANRCFKLEDVPLTRSVDAVISDHEGNMWFCSSRQGVMKIVENIFLDISAMAGMPSVVVNATCQLGSDLYIGTDSGMYIIGDKLRMIENDMTKLLSGIRIRCIRKDTKDRLWICTYSDYGLICYEPKKGSYSVYNTDNGMASNRVRMVKVLADGRIAAATNEGVSIVKDGKVLRTYNGKQKIGNLEILTIEETASGRLLFGSDGDGIYVLENDTIRRLGAADGLRSEVILRIVRDPEEDKYWIVTSNSIAYLENDKITTVNKFPYSNNFDIHFDHHDRMWILSSNGVYVVKKKDMTADHDIDYTLYDIEGGLQRISTANSFSELTEKGDLYISGTNGISSVNIDNEATNSSNIKLVIPYIMADDKRISVREQTIIHIPSDCRRVNIYAGALTYSLNNPQLNYCLQGFDENPIEIKKKDISYISYTNLKGGNYTFQLNVLDTMTGEIVQSRSVTLVKEMSLYEHWGFRVLLVVGLVLLAAILILVLTRMYYRRKTAVLVKKQEENRRLINEMTNVFARTIDMKDAYTNGHSSRVAMYTALLARRLGKSEEEVEKIYNIALLHDIGKISIPDEILNKPGKLTDEEYEVMKSHPSRGYDILKDITLAPELALGAGFHHEKIDGTGYPKHLKGDEIPEAAQLIAIADTFDAMYSNRPYRKKMELEAVVREIRRCAGTQFNQHFAEVFLELIEEGVVEQAAKEYDQQHPVSDCDVDTTGEEKES